MKLTNYMRDAFVRAVMNDVPAGHNFEYEAQELVIENVKANTPAEITAAFKKHPEFFDTMTYVDMPMRFSNFCTGLPMTSALLRPRDHDSELWIKLQELARQKHEQDGERVVLERKVRAAIYACSTRKQALERMPEFEKYLPADEAAATKNVPAIANVVADLVKAGWPKGEAK